MVKTPVIKVGFCVAYDWEFLKKSLPRVYDDAESICLSIDKKQLSWSGVPYEFDTDAFFSWIKEIDRQGKITVYEDDFFMPELSSIQNDNRQRTLMAQFMGEGGWHIQIDSDEYFLDFKGFAAYLKKINPNPIGLEKPINICCQSLSLFKKTARGYLVIDNTDFYNEVVPIATNKPEYLGARRNSHFNHLSPFFFIHETWARDDKQLLQKLDSWGHDNDFVNKESYIEFWRCVNEYTYQFISDFHPIQREVWNKLKYFETTDINTLCLAIGKSDLVKLDRINIWFRNSRNYNRAIFWMERIKKRLA